MKAYTDIEQSKKLVEILPIESADMWWNFYSVTTDNTTPQIIHLNTPWVGNFNWDNTSDNVPCWSLAALLAAIPIEHNLHGYLTENGMVYRVETLYAGNSKSYDNPIDACVAMIEKLNEQKLL